MVAADLARQVRTLLVDSLPFAQEINPDLIRRHDLVNAELASERWGVALGLCDDILRFHPRSPRAHYNRACALSKLCAQSNSERRAGLLEDAQKAFVSAMENGMVQLVSLYLQSKDPFKAIHDEQALQHLFRERPGLVTQYLGEDKRPRLSGFAAYGTCMAADMPVHLGTGGFKTVAEIVPGEAIASWHPAERREVAGCVRAISTSTASELVCINHGLRFTAAHPILTARGWLPAGELSGDSWMQLASGRFERVRSIEIVPQRSEVVDVSVTPWQSFVVAGVVVHNKYPADLLDRLHFPERW